MDTCAICLEDIVKDSPEKQYYTLNCKHVYHLDCITRWLYQNPTCPMCREPIDSDPQYVIDGIITEEDRVKLENGFVFLAVALEKRFPRIFGGYTQDIYTLFGSEHGKELLDNATKTIYSPVHESNDHDNNDIVGEMSGLLYSRFNQNGGFTGILENFVNSICPH